MNKIIGIIGCGFVGNALYQFFKEFLSCRVFDIDESRCIDELEATLKSDIIFVCLPTPMSEDGSVDLSYINNFFKHISTKYHACLKDDNQLFVIKSTVPIGTTEELVKKYQLRIVHYPEFLTAANAVEDFKNSTRHVVGGNLEWATELVELLQFAFPNSTCKIVKSDESELIKYFVNSFLATKVVIFNLLHEICEKYNIDFNTVRDNICSDTRIGHSHSFVPGPDGSFGFGGACFPKDLNGLMSQLIDNDINHEILEEVWKYNCKIRK